MTKRDEGYKITDLSLAAFLKVKGFKLSRIHRGADGKGVFVFEDRPGREELVLKFINREELVEPIAFLAELRYLKGMVRVS